MKKRIFSYAIILIGIFFLSQNTPAYAAGPTVVSTNITVPTTWTIDGSPYIIRPKFDSGSIFVNSSLTIEPGVVVKFYNKNISLSITGSLTAVGTPEEKIIFTSYKDDTFGGDTNGDGSSSVPQKGDWYAIINNGQATFENVIVLYGSSSPATAALFSYKNTFIVRNSVVQDALYAGIGFYNVTEAIIENNTISGAAVGMYLYKFASGKVLKISHNVIAGNTGFGARVDGLIWWQPQYPLDLRGNWWGDVSGPYYKRVLFSLPENLLGKGNKVGDGILFDSWLASNPFEIPVGCTENCFSNVMFLPGLEASRLYIPDGATDGYQVWEPYEEADAKKLYLNESGKSINQSVYTKDVIDNVYIPVKGNIYKSFLNDLERWKNDDKLIVDYAAIPYDWRLSLDGILNNGKKTGENISYIEPTESPYIISELRRLASTSKSGKVTIIAHSNGGLVAKALVNKLGTEAAQLIDKIVFVAVPQTGTPQAIGAILHGYDQGLPVNWLPFTLTPKIARTLAQNMPSAYNLLPSDAYFSGAGSGVITPVITFEDGASTDIFISKYGKKIDTLSELHDFLVDTDNKVSVDSSDIVSPSKINSGLLSSSDGTHQALDYWSPPATIAVYQIAGFGEETLGTIKYWTGEECLHEGGKICSSRVPKLEYTPELIIDGDGTVVAPSALAMSTSLVNVKRYWVDLKKYDTFFNLGRKHANILEVPELRDFIKDNILTQSVATFPNYLSASEPPITSEKRLRYFLHSPLALSAHDGTGNEISTSVSTIPSARYERFGEVQYISLPASSHPTVVLDGVADGSFTLEIQEVEGETVTATTTFSGIPNSADTKATMDFSDGTIADASPLAVDYDGNGTTDFSLKPKLGETVVFDTIPPEANIRFNPDTKKLDIAGKDNVSDSVTVAMTEGIATLRDEVGNTTLITFAKNEAGKQIKFEMSSLAYNDVAVSLLPATLHYEWSLEKTGDVKMLNGQAVVGDTQIQFHYLAKDNVTVITKTDNSVTTKETKAGLAILRLVTERGTIKIIY